MHIFVYEWVTGGGMVEHSVTSVGSLLQEGTTMVRSVAGDFSRIPDTRVTVFRDVQLATLPVAGCDVIDIDSRGAHDEEFDRFVDSADATLLIAPEFDAVLTNLVSRAESRDARLISPGSEFVRIASDKQRTAERLAASGVPVPTAVVLEPDDPLPRDFPYPAVLKPIDGCGSQDIYVVATPFERPPPYAWPRRIEQYVPGLAASVAVLSGSAGLFPLAPCRQSLSNDGRLRYLGGSLPLASGLAKRACDLALLAVRALPTCTGFVGVDLVLGGNPEGGEDVVIEINPRITTSYVGLRAVVEQNLAEQMLRVARGAAAEVSFKNWAVEFDTLGTVSFTD
ncbi:MAG: ATP-grasp domain-containing protein [Pirellulales bacterium]